MTVRRVSTLVCKQVMSIHVEDNGNRKSEQYPFYAIELSKIPVNIDSVN